METWKDIPGFEGYYQASNIGNIRALPRKVKSPRGERLVRGRMMKQANSGGYLITMICIYGCRYNRLVHRLIANTFKPNPLNLPCVNHLDGNKKNNNESNLEWCTYSENEQHSYKMLGKSVPRGKDSSRYKHGKFCKSI